MNFVLVPPLKPRYMEACNHCGLCCRLELCPAGIATYGEEQKGPCPALTRRGNEWLCGLVLAEREGRMKPLIEISLGIGSGCSMPDAWTTQEEVDQHEEYATTRAKDLLARYETRDGPSKYDRWVTPPVPIHA
jgi:ferredoxin